MSNEFHVRIIKFSNIGEISGAWTTADFKAQLDVMEFGDHSAMSDDELREMCILSLQDMKPADAAYLVLKHHMGDVLRDGQMRDLANEMQEEKLWEEYSDSSLHERMFNVGSLLYSAHPGSFPEPDAVCLSFEVTAINASAKALLTMTRDESFLVRLLADGMDDHAILHRLYGDQLKGKSFPIASEVIWILRAEVTGEDSMKFEIISSGYWLDALIRVKNYQSAAYAD